MNPTPDQPSNSSVPLKVPASNPVTPAVSAPPNISPPSPPPPINYQPPTTTNQPLTHDHSHKFPFMMVTFLLVVVIAGFTGSFLFFSYTSPAVKKAPVGILITPPVTIVPSLTSTPAPNNNPFASSSSELVNPFASPTASLVNPFGTYQNPFATASASTESGQSYQNPFEKLK